MAYDIELDSSRESPATDATACPACGSMRVRFRVQRTGVSHRPLQERSLTWECRQCTTHWTEPLSPLAPVSHTPPSRGA